MSEIQKIVQERTRISQLINAFTFITFFVAVVINNLVPLILHGRGTLRDYV